MKKTSIIFIAIIVFASNVFAQTENEIKREFIVQKNAKIRLSSSNKNLQISSWKEDKVKVSFVLNNVDDKNSEDVFQKAGIDAGQLGNTVNISINSSSINDKYKARTLIIYIPESAKLTADSRYGNITFTNYFSNLDLDLTNVNVEAGNISTLKLNSKYGNFNVGDIGSAQVDFINGTFSAGNIDEMDLDTKYSNIEIASVKQLSFNSTNDDYNIENAVNIQGRKNYGNMRISELSGSIQLDGTNADVKIRNITASVREIKIDNKYASLQLPLKDLKDFVIDFIGAYSTVYAPFEKTSKELNGSSEGLNTGDHFTATVGRGAGAKVDVKCQNCTVDFK